jgi:hypothetical protein
MPTLSQDAQDIFMTHRCPRCGVATTSGEQVRLTYNDKLKLFREHAVESESAV